MFRRTNFFAILKKKNDEVSLKRIQLSGEAQQRLSEMFTQASKELLDENLERVPFDGRYNPDEGEIHVVYNFKLPSGILEALEEPTSVNELRLDEHNFPVIKGIFTGTTDRVPTIAFQKFTRSQFITKAGMNLFFSGNTFTTIRQQGINLPNKIDAILHNGHLLFKSFWNARQVLDLSFYYREATDEDLSEFLEHPAINTSELEDFVFEADTWVRRKVAFIRDNGILEKYSPRQIVEKAAEYDLILELTNQDGQEQIILPSAKRDIKEVLRFLDEDIYSGPLSETRYVSNSKRRY